jgi:hypothetical protein
VAELSVRLGLEDETAVVDAAGPEVITFDELAACAERGRQVRHRARWKLRTVCPACLPSHPAV